MSRKALGQRRAREGERGRERGGEEREREGERESVYMCHIPRKKKKYLSSILFQRAFE